MVNLFSWSEVFGSPSLTNRYRLWPSTSRCLSRFPWFLSIPFQVLAIFPGFPHVSNVSLELSPWCSTFLGKKHQAATDFRAATIKPDSWDTVENMVIWSCLNMGIAPRKLFFFRAIMMRNHWIWGYFIFRQYVYRGKQKYNLWHPVKQKTDLKKYNCRAGATIANCSCKWFVGSCPFFFRSVHLVVMNCEEWMGLNMSYLRNWMFLEHPGAINCKLKELLVVQLSITATCCTGSACKLSPETAPEHRAWLEVEVGSFARWDVHASRC